MVESESLSNTFSICGNTLVINIAVSDCCVTVVHCLFSNVSWGASTNRTLSDAGHVLLCAQYIA